MAVRPVSYPSPTLTASLLPPAPTLPSRPPKPPPPAPATRPSAASATRPQTLAHAPSKESPGARRPREAARCARAEVDVPRIVRGESRGLDLGWQGAGVRVGEMVGSLCGDDVSGRGTRLVRQDSSDRRRNSSGRGDVPCVGLCADVGSRMSVRVGVA